MIDFSSSMPVPDDTNSFDEHTRELRWFLLPSEAAAQIRNEIGEGSSVIFTISFRFSQPILVSDVSSSLTGSNCDSL